MRLFLAVFPYRPCRTCRLPYGHATAHQDRPTLREFIAGWMYRGREGGDG